MLVRADVALEQLRKQASATTSAGAATGGGGSLPLSGKPTETIQSEPKAPTKPRRFFGSVEIDMVRPVKSFDTILNAVIMELQRTPGTKVKVLLEIEAEAPSGFGETEVGVVRDNAKQLKFNPGSTGFSDET